MAKSVSPPLATNRRKQLLFDRRYGWVYEEWTDPVEVANIGSRGMFSLVPLTAASIDGTLRVANLAADAVARTLQSHQLSFWPFQIQRTADQEKTPQVPIPDVPIDRPVPPSFVRFPRRILVDEIDSA